MTDIYLTLLPGAFNRAEDTAGRTVQVCGVEVDSDITWIGFTWAENPYDVEWISSQFFRNSTDEEIAQAKIDYKNQGARFT